MHNLKKSLLNLSVGEFSAACMFIYVYISSGLITIGISNFIAFLYLIFILLQGSMYWFYKYRLIANRKHYSLKSIKFFSVLRQLNIIIVIVIIITIPIIMNNFKDLLIAIALLIFGIIEYINYYWYRLSYGKSGFNIKILCNRELQKSSINKMLNRQS